MYRFVRLFSLGFCLVWTVAPGLLPGSSLAYAGGRHTHAEPPQETGFLNRRIESRGFSFRYQVYLPEEWRRDDHKQWPILLFLHGRGERGSEGMWQTQVGLPQAVRDHPERWPFVIVMPQCPLSNFWTDPEMLTMALETLDREAAEFHGDPEHTYLSGLSLGGYGAWELARLQPRRWAAVAIAAGGPFWSYAPERWKEAATLPGEYAHAIGRTPVWLFHGSDDNVVSSHQSELMYEALKANGGRVRLWIFQGLKHDCWTRAYNEPELPRWLLSHHVEPPPRPRPGGAPEPAFFERLIIPLHPPVIKLATAQLDSLSGEYRDGRGQITAMIFRQGEQLYVKNMHGETFEIAPESPSVFFYPNGSSITRITFEREEQGRETVAIYRDDRHEERWEKRATTTSR